MKKDDIKVTDILLESGTNELEMVEFLIGQCHYGINVTKVREIIRTSEDIVPVPDSHFSVEGAINLRGKVIPVVNLAKHLSVNVAYDKKNSRIIVAEFNHLIIGFWVSSVTRIHRLSWKSVETPSDLVQSKGGYAVGVVKIDNKILFLLDFEKIAADINPKSGLQNIDGMPNIYNKPGLKIDRSTKTILVVEDSVFVRELMLSHLHNAGYMTKIATNGEEAWNIIEGFTQKGGADNLAKGINLVVTDIEMPQMDGLHLLARIKKEAATSKLPVIVFSSMISKELSIKCRGLGANGEIAKPQIDQLVTLADANVI